jgi:hypothetical protein
MPSWPEVKPEQSIDSAADFDHSQASEPSAAKSLELSCRVPYRQQGTLQDPASQEGKANGPQPVDTDEAFR